jgi:hypothetical protein
MKSPLRTLSISVLGLAVAGLIGVSAAGSASAHESLASSVSASGSSSVNVTTVVSKVNLAIPSSWSWGGVRPGTK